jgi:GNAT superfamily N-acetyltransferase
VAFIDEEPVSTGCCSIDGEVGRLYGAVTLPEYRSRGCYQAVISSRLRQACDLGATIALTRGRPLTSGRILVKAGFTVHGQENCYRLTIA